MENRKYDPDDFIVATDFFCNVCRDIGNADVISVSSRYDRFSYRDYVFVL